MPPQFKSILLSIFVTMFIKDIGLWFWFICPVLTQLWYKVISVFSVYFLLNNLRGNGYTSSLKVQQSFAVNISGPGIVLFLRVFITVPISLFLMGLFRLLITS